MNIWGVMLVIATFCYIAVCFGKIAARYGKNPVLYGILSIISPVNLIILGYWAFSGTGTHEKPYTQGSVQATSGR